MSKTNHILFVCLGNICRSPVAEALFRQKISHLGLQGQYAADSAGTAGYHVGEFPDPRTLMNAKRNNLHLEHKARQLESQDFVRFDWILVMDKSNFRDAANMTDVPIQRDKILMLRSFDTADEEDEVPDPWFGGEEGFQKVYEIIDRSVDGFLEWLVKNN